MNKLINFSQSSVIRALFCIVLSFPLINQCTGQNSSKPVSKSSFIEWNIGLANLDQQTWFPGTSVLYGMTFLTENNTIYEFEIGIAAPSIATAKIGVGKKLENFTISAGIRPFPFNLYAQTSIPTRKRGNWIASIEYNPIDNEQLISFGSKGILNIGYRWNLRSKK